MTISNINNSNEINLWNFFSEIFKKGLVYSSVSLFQQLLNFFLIPIYTLYLLPEDFGVMAVMTTTAGIILALTKAPLAYGFVRFYYSPDYFDNRKKIYFNSVFSVILRAIVPSIIFIILSGTLSTLLLGRNDYERVIILYAFIILFQPLEDMSQDLLKIQKKAVLLAIVQIVNLIISSTIIIICLISGLEIYSLIYGLLFSTIFPVIVLIPAMIRNMEPKFDFQILKPIYKYGNPLIILVLSQFLINNVDFYIIKSFLTLNEVGLYSFASKFGALLGVFLIFPLRNIFEPVIFNLEKREKVQKELLINFTKFFYVICIFIFTILSVFSFEIVKLLASSKEFYSSWSLIPFVAFAYICFGLMDYFGKGLEIAKKTKLMSIIYLTGAITNILMNIILINHYSLYGVILSKIISFMVILILCAHFSKKHYQIEFPLIHFMVIASPIIIFNILIVFVGGVFSLLNSKLLFFLFFLLFLFLIIKKWIPFHFKMDTKE